MTVAEIIQYSVAIGTLFFVGYKAFTDRGRSDVDIYTKAAQALITPLTNRIEELEAKSDRDDAVIAKLLSAFFGYLNDRATRLKDYPGCGACLSSDELLRQKIIAISRERDMDRTKPVKES